MPFSCFCSGTSRFAYECDSSDAEMERIDDEEKEANEEE